MDKLETIAAQLRELIRIAQEANDPLLVYLLEMALAETYDEIAKRRA